SGQAGDAGDDCLAFEVADAQVFSGVEHRETVARLQGRLRFGAGTGEREAIGRVGRLRQAALQVEAAGVGGDVSCCLQGAVAELGFHITAGNAVDGEAAGDAGGDADHRLVQVAFRAEDGEVFLRFETAVTGGHFKVERCGCGFEFEAGATVFKVDLPAADVFVGVFAGGLRVRADADRAAAYGNAVSVAGDDVDEQVAAAVGDEADGFDGQFHRCVCAVHEDAFAVQAAVRGAQVTAWFGVDGYVHEAVFAEFTFCVDLEAVDADGDGFAAAQCQDGA